MKKFNELTKAGQTKRINAYKEQNAKLGVEQNLFVVSKEATIKELDNGDKYAQFVLINTKDKKSVLGSAYIKAGKDALQGFYESLSKGQLVSVRYKTNGQYINIWEMMKREKKAVVAA